MLKLSEKWPPATTHTPSNVVTAHSERGFDRQVGGVVHAVLPLQRPFSPHVILRTANHDHHVPSGKCRKRITTSLGIATEPDWVHEPTKVVVYLDEMNRGLHGDPISAAA